MCSGCCRGLCCLFVFLAFAFAVLLVGCLGWYRLVCWWVAFDCCFCCVSVYVVCFSLVWVLCGWVFGCWIFDALVCSFLWDMLVLVSLLVLRLFIVGWWFRFKVVLCLGIGRVRLCLC